MCLWARDSVVATADIESMRLPEISIMSSHPFMILVLNLTSYLHPLSWALTMPLKVDSGHRQWICQCVLESLVWWRRTKTIVGCGGEGNQKQQEKRSEEWNSMIFGGNYNQVQLLAQRVKTSQLRQSLYAMLRSLKFILWMSHN